MGDSLAGPIGAALITATVAFVLGAVAQIEKLIAAAQEKEAEGLSVYFHVEPMGSVVEFACHITNRGPFPIHQVSVIPPFGLFLEDSGRLPDIIASQGCWAGLHGALGVDGVGPGDTKTLEIMLQHGRKAVRRDEWGGWWLLFTTGRGRKYYCDSGRVPVRYREWGLPYPIAHPCRFVKNVGWKLRFASDLERGKYAPKRYEH